VQQRSALNIASLTGLRKISPTASRASLKTLFHECKLLIEKGMVKRRSGVHSAGSVSKTKVVIGHKAMFTNFSTECVEEAFNWRCAQDDKARFPAIPLPALPTPPPAQTLFAAPDAGGRRRLCRSDLRAPFDRARRRRGHNQSAGGVAGLR
jgi:hypothetical protein